LATQLESLSLLALPLEYPSNLIYTKPVESG